MGKKIGSLFYEIGADTGKLKKGLQDSKQEMGDLRSGFEAGSKAIATGFGFIAAEATILKKVFDFGKEQAQIQFTAEKFDTLAESIGTTGDVLLKDLKSATGGLIGDFELMASATDFMTLGLAKSREEAVRLTSAAGQLNMDMNQLVLTLTNQTTMRFDALGISVDGFDEKVQALKDTGMDANAAFNEAFLQQAEEQIAKVGSVTDSSVASFMKLEAATSNLSNEIKQAFVPVLADAAEGAYTLFSMNQRLVDAFDEHNKEVMNTATTYDAYIEETLRAADAGGILTGQQKRLLEKYIEGEPLTKNATANAKDLAEKLGLVGERGFYAAKAVTAQGEEAAAASSPNMDYADALSSVTETLSDVNLLMRDYTKELFFQQAAALLDADGQLALAKEMGLVSENTAYAMDKLAGLEAAYLSGAITAEEYQKKTAILGQTIQDLEDKDITVRVNYVYAGGASNSEIGPIGGMEEQLKAGGGPVMDGSFIWGEYGRPEIYQDRYGVGGNVVNPQNLQEMMRTAMSGGGGAPSVTIENINNYISGGVDTVQYSIERAMAEAL